jgi:hypothetical protein
MHPYDRREFFTGQPGSDILFERSQQSLSLLRAWDLATKESVAPLGAIVCNGVVNVVV